MRAYVITLLGNKIGYLIPKVESGLLQIDPAHRWNFSKTFFEKSKQWQEREQAKIVDVRKRNSKLSGKSSTTELGQFEVNLTRL